ncbi:hypothetical protein PCAR4_810076 [Paraburkholderia caribensis]|nr:hypothetical protein PCAR4_810076 [Paraburkholderia caribensis]
MTPEILMNFLSTTIHYFELSVENSPDACNGGSLNASIEVSTGSPASRLFADQPSNRSGMQSEVVVDVASATERAVPCAR